MFIEFEPLCLVENMTSYATIGIIESTWSVQGCISTFAITAKYGDTKKQLEISASLSVDPIKVIFDEGRPSISISSKYKKKFSEGDIAYSKVEINNP